jgi:DNA replication protein DnaC
MFNEYYENLLPKLYKKAQLTDFQESHPKLVEFAKTWINNPKSLFVYGEYGVGKTHFVCALVRELAIRNPHNWPLFHSSPTLDGLLLEAIRSDHSVRSLMDKVCEAEVLIIDDMGREMKTDRLRRQHFEIINHRYSHCKITIMTSNCTVEGLHDVFEDAVLSRIRSFDFVEITGKDRRIK